MTNKLTIEQARRLRNDFECWQQDYDPKDDKEQYDMFGRGMAAMDMLIAGMYQEPVGEFYEDGPLNWYQISDGDRVPAHRRIPLYRHAQQPVVRKIDRKAIADKVYGKCCRIPGATFYNAAEFAIDEVEACRAAMIQAGNSPVIPDGWVMVPKEPTEAMMLHKSECQHHAWDDPDCAMRQTRRLIWSHMLAAAQHDNPALNTLQSVGIANRWMPLPEPPQEVK